MPRYLFFFTILLPLISPNSYGQDYLRYHEYINLAETHLVNGGHDSAFIYYDKAFNEYDFIFAKDALVAAQFAWKQRNKEKTIEYLIKGAHNGLRSRCLELAPIMKSFTEERFYLKLYDSLAAANQIYNAALDRSQSDDWINKQDAIVLALSTNEMSEFVDAVRNNVGRIKELVSKGRFPGERYVGIGNDCVTLSNPSVFYSLANYDCIVSEMHDALWTAVRKGELHPREFAAIWEWEFVKSAHQMKYITGPFVNATARNYARIYMKDNTYVTVNRECDKSKQVLKRFRLLLEVDDMPKEEFDKNRAQYYITSIETDKKKKELQVTEGYLFFFGNK